MALSASIETQFPEWYQEIITKAQLSESGPVRGTIVIRPYAYAMWERLQGHIDTEIKRRGAQNAYFPLFIPASYLEREAEHVEGFSPELALVTHAGGKELESAVVVRPTSETVIGEYMAKWVHSHRDLPMLLNQWANVVRWEMRPRAFLRTTEFLWQEGHTAHATQQDARDYAQKILHEVYAPFLSEFLSLPVIVGVKTRRERFAGATRTMTCEGMMGDGKALQLCTSHELGQNFSKAFNISFTGSDGVKHLAWTTSWGMSSRVLGGVIMGHGDQHGLRLPPPIAPYEVVIVALGDEDSIETVVRAMANEFESAGLRYAVDRDTARSFGARATDWELKGVPVRIDVGKREASQGAVTATRRDSREKVTLGTTGIVESVSQLLANIHSQLSSDASDRLKSRTRDVHSIDDALDQVQTGFARMHWSALGEAGELALNAKGASVRCLTTESNALPAEDEGDDVYAIIARAY